MYRKNEAYYNDTEKLIAIALTKGFNDEFFAIAERIEELSKSDARKF